jgi:hypothetical protein
MQVYVTRCALYAGIPVLITPWPGLARSQTFGFSCVRVSWSGVDGLASARALAMTRRASGPPRRSRASASPICPVPGGRKARLLRHNSPDPPPLENAAGRPSLRRFDCLTEIMILRKREGDLPLIGTVAVKFDKPSVAAATRCPRPGKFNTHSDQAVATGDLIVT